MDSGASVASASPPSSWLPFWRSVVAALVLSAIHPISGSGLDALATLAAGITLAFGPGLIFAALITGIGALFLTEPTRRHRRLIFLSTLWFVVVVLKAIVWLDHYGVAEFARPLLLSFVSLGISALLITPLVQKITAKVAGFKPRFLSALKAVFVGLLVGNLIFGIPELVAAANQYEILPIGYAAMGAACIAGVVVALGYLLRTDTGVVLGIQRGMVVGAATLVALSLFFGAAAGGALLVRHLTQPTAEEKWWESDEPAG